MTHTVQSRVLWGIYGFGTALWLGAMVGYKPGSLIFVVMLLAGFVCMSCWAALSVLWPGRPLLVLAQAVVILLWGGFLMPVAGRVLLEMFPKFGLWFRVGDVCLVAAILVMVVTVWRAVGKMLAGRRRAGGTK